MQIILFSSGKPDGRTPAASLSHATYQPQRTALPPRTPAFRERPHTHPPSKPFFRHRTSPSTAATRPAAPGTSGEGGGQGSSHPSQASRRDVRVLNQAIRPRLLPSAWRAERHLRHPAFLRSLADAGFLSASCAGTPAAIKYAGTDTKNIPETVPIVFSGSIAAQRYEYFTFFHYIGIVMYNI